MSDPNDKQKCGTCHGLTWVTVENSFYPRTNPCPACKGEGYVYEGEAITGRGPDDVFPEQVACEDCAPRGTSDGSAAEVKRYRVREGRTPSCPDYYVDSEIVDEEVVLASDYDALLSRVAELERDAARLKLQHSELATAANNLLTRKLGINEERLVLRVRESDFDALCAALSKGAQP